jgi:hypothetical protein
MYGDEAVVLITYPVLGRLEIEHPQAAESARWQADFHHKT